MFIAYLVASLLFACLPRSNVLCVMFIAYLVASLLFACLPCSTLCYVYCLPGCFPTVCVSASLYSVLCLLLTLLLPYCCVCLPCLLRKDEGPSRIVCFLGRGHDGKTLCQSCGRGCDSTVEEKGIKEGAR